MSQVTVPSLKSAGTTPTLRQFIASACDDCGLIRDISGSIPVDPYIDPRGSGIAMLCLGDLANRRAKGETRQRASAAGRIISTYPDPNDGEA